MAHRTSSDRLQPQEDLGRLLELEHDLATGLEAARQESTTTIERARVEALRTAERIRETEAARRRAAEEQVGAYRRDQLAAVAADGLRRAEHYRAISEERVRSLGIWIVQRLLGQPAPPGGRA